MKVCESYDNKEQCSPIAGKCLKELKGKNSKPKMNKSKEEKEKYDAKMQAQVNTMEKCITDEFDSEELGELRTIII